ncbi:MAG: isopenicillin N synthase-like dioxygenase [Ilumatobacter sp.]
MNLIPEARIKITRNDEQPKVNRSATALRTRHPGGMSTAEFDPEAKERALRAESSSWDVSNPVPANPQDIPIIDISAWVASDDNADLTAIGANVNAACETVGFFQLTGHTVERSLIDEMFDMNKRFFALPLDAKQQIRMDRTEWPVGGVGYLPMYSRKLPSRAKANLNEAFLIKGNRDLTLGDSQWLKENQLPGFRDTVIRYATAINELALKLLPIYATALGLSRDFFAPGFAHPSWRLRMTHYPPVPKEREIDADFGIPPHVDTTFFTLLLQNAPGLTVYNQKRECWIQAPVVDGAFVVNSGELLKQWTNDRYVSVRHFANNDAADSRYSIPFFYNAAADYPMECLPTCHSADNPPRYPTISYQQSQAAAQGE